jgi:hypothetical protein
MNNIRQLILLALFVACPFVRAEPESTSVDREVITLLHSKSTLIVVAEVESLPLYVFRSGSYYPRYKFKVIDALHGAAAKESILEVAFRRRATFTGDNPLPFTKGEKLILFLKARKDGPAGFYEATADYTGFQPYSEGIESLVMQIEGTRPSEK